MTNFTNAPETLKTIQPEHVVELDVRPILKSGGEPFKEIMEAVGRTPESGAFRLRATFEPTPLFRVLGKQGWKHWVEYGAGDDWLIWFYHEAAPSLDKALEPVIARYPDLPGRIKTAGQEWILDVRDLAPPEPMEITLAVLDRIPQGVRLIQINERVPQFLLPLLEERGMRASVLKEEEHDVRIEIKREGE